MSRLPMLAGVCALLALGSGTARAQAPAADPALQRPAPAATVDHPRAGLRLATPQSNLSGQSRAGPPTGTLASSDRLGVSAPAYAVAAATDPNEAVQNTVRRRRGPGVALMIVGAAGVITGLLIDESLITIAGAGFGLVGLYLYVR